MSEAKTDTTAVVAPPTSGPLQLLEIAVESGADVDKLEKLMDMKERYDAQQARSTFFDAFSEFQSNCPPIAKTARGHNTKYTPLPAIAQAVAPWLHKVGLSYRFEQEQTESALTVTCVVTHRDGHSERTSLSAPADTSGSKNAIQSIGSTMTYLQRYTLIMALGITTADADDDGNAASGPKTVSEAQAAEIRRLLKKAGTTEAEALKGKGIESVEEIQADRAKTLIDALRKRVAGKKDA